jgi:hypothetical protein
MKSTLAVVVFIILSFNFSVKSQAYDSLVIENAQWRVAYYSEDVPAEMFGWLLRGDTLLNGYQYKKVFKRHFQDYNSNVIDTQYLFGVMREDVENKLVYAIQFYESAGGCSTINSEFRLYDFSCQLEDTLLICFTDPFQYSFVHWVDTVFYFGKLRRIFTASYSVDFIEGIGHVAGLFEDPMMPVKKELNYFYSELIDYCVGSDEECFVYYVKVDESAINSDFVIYPNPCNGSFTIQPPDTINSIWHYSLYNFLGECIQKGDIFNKNGIIKLKNQGCYYLKLISDQNMTFTKKVICNF